MDSEVLLLRRMLLPLLRFDGAQRCRRSGQYLFIVSETPVSSTSSIVLTWLDDVNRCILEESLEVPTRVQSLPKRYRARRLSVELFDAFWVLAKKRFLNEQRMVRFEGFGKLLRHRLMQSPMEIDSSIHAECLHGLKSLHARLKHFGRVQPPNILSSIHLDRPEPLRQTLFGSALNIARSIAANPGIHVDSVADFAAQQLPNWDVEFTRFQVPKSDVDAGESGHEHWSAAVEGFPPGILPECFDVIGFVADEAGDVAVESAFDCFGVSLCDHISP